MKYNKSAFFLLVLFYSIIANAQTLSFIRGTSYNVSLAVPLLHLRIPIELAKGIDSSKLKITIADVHSDRFPDPFPITVFKNIFIADTLGSSFINIDINNAPTIPPAAYVLNLRAFKKPDDGAAQEKYVITITVNAAVISVPGTVYVEKKGWPGSGYESNDTLIYLKETGGKSQLTGLTLHPIKMTDANNRPVSGIIEVDTPGNINAGENGKLVFKTVGDFPIGKTTANLELTAPQLTTAVPITIEITTRRGPLFLIGLLLSGLLLGFLTRVFLTKIIALNSARLPGVQLLGVLASAAKNRQDAVFTNEINRITTDLKTGLNKVNADAITAAVTTAKNDLNAAIMQFNIKLKTGYEALDSFQNIVSTLTTLTLQFAGVTGDAGTVISKVKLNLEQGLIDDSTVLINAENKTLTAAFYKALTQFKQTYLNYLNDIEHAGFKIPEIKDASDQIVSSLNGIVDGVHASIDPTIFATINNIQQKTGDLLYSIGRIIHNTIGDIFKAFQPVMKQMSDPDAIDNIHVITESIISGITDSNAKLDDVLLALPGKLSNLKSSLHDAFMAQTNDEGEQDPAKKANNQTLRTTIETDLNADAYLKAADGVVEFVKVNPQGERGNINGAEAIASFVGNPLVVNGSFPVNQIFMHITETILPTATSNVDLTFQKVEATITAATVVQTILVGGAILFVGYTLNVDTFIGTTSDIAAVFFWAFLINVSLSTLTENFFTKVIKPK